MSLVGPRPDVPILPGCPSRTAAGLLLWSGPDGWATLHFRDEERLLPSPRRADGQLLRGPDSSQEGPHSDLDYAAVLLCAAT